jgi:AcrR family transcriptional regulator
MTKAETAKTSRSRSTSRPAVGPAPTADDARSRNVEAFLDAAERLLVEVGHAGITTRRLAGEAGLNQGLVHYYFGSLDEVLLQALERFTERLIERQRGMYQAKLPFIERWSTAMEYLESDLGAGYPKIWLELQALGWNRPEIRERIARVNAEWREVLTEAFVNAAAEYGLQPEAYPVDALVSLVMTFNQGVELERLSGIIAGHDELLAWVDAWLRSLEEGP